MNDFVRNPSIRQGQFLWRDELDRENYVVALKEKINNGFYFTDKVLSKIVEEMAPVLDEITNR